MTATTRAPLDFAELPQSGRYVPLDQIDFMRLAKLAHHAIQKMGQTKLPPGVTKEQMAAMAITQLFTEELEALAE